MANNHIQFNTDFYLDSYVEADLYFNTDKGLHLRPKDSQGRFDPYGTYPEYSVCETINFTPNKLTEIFALSHEAVIPDGASITYEISVDGGTTWYYADATSGLILVTDDTDETQWSGILVMEQYLSDLVFSMDAPQYKFKIRFASDTTRASGPELLSLFVTYELEYNKLFDFKQSLKAYLVDNYQIKNMILVSMDEEGTTVDLRKEDDALPIIDITHVRIAGSNDNLLDSYNTATKILTLTESKPEDTQLIIKITAQPKIYMSADEDFEIKDPNALVVHIMDKMESAFNRAYTYVADSNIAKNVARIRLAPEVADIYVNLLCYSSYEHIADILSGTLETFLDESAGFTCLGSGLFAKITKASPMINIATPKENIYSQTVTVMFRVEFPYMNYNEIPLLDHINVLLGDGRKLYSRTEIDLETEGITHEEL